MGLFPLQPFGIINNSWCDSEWFENSPALRDGIRRTSDLTAVRWLSSLPQQPPRYIMVNVKFKFYLRKRPDMVGSAHNVVCSRPTIFLPLRWGSFFFFCMKRRCQICTRYSEGLFIIFHCLGLLAKILAGKKADKACPWSASCKQETKQKKQEIKPRKMPTMSTFYYRLV